MRLFLFALTVFFPFHIFGQACTEATINIPDGDATPNSYTCTTLVVGNAGINRQADGSTDPLIIDVSGNVTISSDINLDGGNGGQDLGPFSTGGFGGPGASPGGRFDGASPEPGGVGVSTAADGQIAPADTPCASGGGGAGFSIAGISGSNCATSGFPSNGGTVASTALFQFVLGSFRGGFGGAAGGLNTATNSPGGGGGGGGGLIINASGMITIDSGVTISARGGQGGNDSDGDGAGGGGSGGAVWLIGSLGIVNNGTIDVSGNNGGTSTLGGNGGVGRSGRFRFESAGNSTEGTGISTPDTRSSSSSSSSKLSSDISCGTISKTTDKNQNNLFMIISGFAFVSLISYLSRFRRIKVY